MKQFLGDGEHDFKMTFELGHAFERDQRKSLYGTLTDILNGQWRMDDVTEIIRLGLIGGGMDDIAAFNLVETYVKPRPLAPSVNLARDILQAAFFEQDEDPIKGEVDRVFGKEDGFGGVVTE